MLKIIPKSLSLRAAAIIAIFVILILSLSIFMYITISSHHEMAEKSMITSYAQITDNIAKGFEQLFTRSDSLSFDLLLTDMRDNEDVLSIKIRNENTKYEWSVLDNSVRDPAEEHYEHEFTEPSFVQSLTGTEVYEVGYPEGFFHTGGHNFLFVSRFHDTKNTYYSLEILLSTQSLNQEVARVSLRGLRVVIITLLIGTILILLVDRKLQKVFSNLIQITTNMTRGDLSQKVNINTGDTLETLGESFNKMAQALADREEQLKNNQELLEKRVADRTSELEVERDTLAALINNIPNGLVLLDSDLNIQVVSSSMEDIFTGLKNSKTNIKWEKASFGGGITEDFPAIDQLASGEILNRIYYYSPNGASKTKLEYVAIPIIGSQGLESIIIMITDITVKEQLRNQLIRAEKLMATGEMSAILAHEMRSSIMSVKLILQLLLEKSNNKSETESIEVASESVKRMEKLVSDLLRFAKPGDMNIGPVDPTKLLTETSHFMKTAFEKRGLILNLSYEIDLPEIKVDFNLLKESLINLLNNALQAAEDSTTISLGAHTEVLDEVLDDYDPWKWIEEGLEEESQNIETINFAQGERVLVITVSDTLGGISIEDLSRIFEPFYTTKAEGTGLGLSFVKRIINSHDGIVRIVSDPGKLTKFLIYLPLDKSNE